jgi:purine-cytosine permease-like protein
MGNAQLATLATGFIGIGMGLGLFWSAIAIVFGCAFGTFFMAFHATQGPQLGLPQMIQSRAQFGSMGALLVLFVALVTFIGFNAFNQELAGPTIAHLSGLGTLWGMGCFTLLGLGLALIGYRWIHIVQRLLSAVLIICLLVFSLGALFLAHIQFGAGGFQTTPFLTQFFAAAAYQLSWSIYVSDYSRYLPPSIGVSASFWWTYTGSMLGAAWMMLVGLAVAAISPNLPLADAVQAGGDAIFPGFGKALLGASLLGLITGESLNFYGASLTLLSVADSFRKIKPTRLARLVGLCLAGVAATGIALMAGNNFIETLNNLLSVLLYLFTPWTAINLVDFYVVRKGHYSVRGITDPHGMYGQWNWRGLTAYGAGFAAMIPFFSTALYTGPVAHALGGADIAMLVGLPVSALVYLRACRSLDLAADRALAVAADRGLEV